MRQVRMLLSIPITAALLFYAGTLASAQQHSHELKVGKNGEVTFDKATTVGNITLQPGRYQFQHRVEGTDHLVHFTELTKPNPAYPSQPTSGQPKAHPGEVKCRLEELGSKASQTRIFLDTGDAPQRIFRVEVRGENVAHLL